MTTPNPAYVCSTCGGTGLVDWAPGQIRDFEGDQQPCPDCAPAAAGAMSMAERPSTVVRQDKYAITVDGLRVAASEDQEARIRALSDAQRANFVRLMGDGR